MILEPRFLERLERLALATRGRMSGLYPGEHRSRRLGTSVDFADWRPYVPGDDFRRIDYQIYARLDRLLIRLFESEDELNVRIVLDASESMGFDGKFDMSARIAGAVSYLAACRRDRARVWVSDGSGLHPSPWVRSRDSAIYLLGWLEEVKARGPSDLSDSIRWLAASGGLPGLTLVISDLLTEQWENCLRRLSGPGGEAAVVQVLAKRELEPDFSGDLLLVDSEEERGLEVSVSDQVVRRYRERARSFLNSVSETCRRRGIRYMLAHPDDDLEALLLVDFRREGIIR